MAPAPDRQKDPLFHSRLIRQPGRGLDLSETTLAPRPPQTVEPIETKRLGGIFLETRFVSHSDDLPRRGGQGPHLSETTLFHPRMICPAGQGPHLSETTLFHPRMICPAGQGPYLSETTLAPRPPQTVEPIETKRLGGIFLETRFVSHSDDLPRRGGQGPHLSETTLFHPRMICPAGQGPHLPETNSGGYPPRTRSHTKVTKLQKRCGAACR